MGEQRNATVVLVHGAWHGAWCWERVVAGLTERGVPTLAVDLPGHGAHPGPLGDLYGDAEHLRGVLDGVHGPAVLVGHSYGGAVISQGGDHPSVARLVYLAALVLDEGESCTTAAADHPAVGTISHEGRPNLGAGFVDVRDGTAGIDPAIATAALYNRCDEESVAWALAQLGRQPIRTMRQPATAAAWRARPSTYVVCRDDMAVHPDLQRILAARCTDSVEWDADHSPFLHAPHLVVDLLADLAATAAPTD